MNHIPGVLPSPVCTARASHIVQPNSTYNVRFHFSYCQVQLTRPISVLSILSSPLRLSSSPIFPRINLAEFRIFLKDSVACAKTVGPIRMSPNSQQSQPIVGEHLFRTQAFVSDPEQRELVSYLAYSCRILTSPPLMMIMGLITFQYSCSSSSLPRPAPSHE